MIISLAGFMGCGKSSVGRAIKDLSGCSLVDLDSYIEQSAGRSISEIFASGGEMAFRNMEKEALAEIIAEHGSNALLTVLSLGGGTLTVPECAGLVRCNTFCIYLRAKAETLIRNLKDDAAGRPMLQCDKPLEERIRELLTARESIYEECADKIIDVDSLTYEEAAQAVLISTCPSLRP